MSYTDEQIDAKLNKKQDADCSYNVCEMNQLLTNKVGTDAFNLLKQEVDQKSKTLTDNLGTETQERKEADGLLKNDISSIDVRVASIENRNGVGQDVVVSVEKYSDLDLLTPYDGKSVYVENLGVYTYDSSLKRWVQDAIFNLMPRKFSTNFSNNNGGYKKSARLVLNDGFTTVVSMVDANNVDPNQDMSTWAKVNDIDTKESLTYKTSKTELAKTIAWQNRNVYVQGDGHYFYKNNEWQKDETLNIYDFKTQQYLQYYYNQLGNWDDAIWEAQKNIYLKGFSPKLLFPTGVIDIAKPIVGGIALALKIHDYLVANGIETDFYNSTTNTFKKNVWGQQFVSTRSCTVNWVGSSFGTDKTWRDWAMFHIGCPPTHMDWIQNESISPLVDDHVKFENIIVFGGGAFVHGVFIQRQSFLNTSYLQILSCLGSGLLLDRCYDSVFNKLTVLHCGRMVGDTESEGADNNYGINKQLYAPIHVMRSSGDNCNFLSFKDVHLELNDNVIADIIVTGDSSPISFDTMHFECGGNSKYANGNRKTLFRIGTGSGADCFAIENSQGYDKNNPKLSQSGGYVVANNIAGYSLGYVNGADMGGYAKLWLTDTRVPNGFMNVNIDSGNTSSAFHARGSIIENINIQGGTNGVYPLSLDDCEVKSISVSYIQNIKLRDVRVSGDIKMDNISTFNNRPNPVVLDNVSCNNIIVTNGDLLAKGTISITGSANPSVTLDRGSDLNVIYSGNAVANYLEV